MPKAPTFAKYILPGESNPELLDFVLKNWRQIVEGLYASSETGINVPTALWLDICEFIEDHVDVRDGSDGVPLPNRAMSLVNAIQREVKNAAPQGDGLAASGTSGRVSPTPAVAAPSVVASTALLDGLPEANELAGMARDARRWRFIASRINYRDETLGDPKAAHCEVRVWSHQTSDRVSDSFTVAVDKALASLSS